MAIIKIVASSVLAALLALGGLLAFGASDAGSHQLGALSGPDISSPYLTWGGVPHWAAHTNSLKQASTVVCALQSPAATSTLVSGGIRLSVSSTTASTVTVAKAATATATTTLINSASVSANAQATVLFASTTDSALAQTNRIFAPNTYLTVGMAGGTGTFSPTGVCQAEWQAL